LLLLLLLQLLPNYCPYYTASAIDPATAAVSAATAHTATPAPIVDFAFAASPAVATRLLLPADSRMLMLLQLLLLLPLLLSS
jgi:hypothetical protein